MKKTTFSLAIITIMAVTMLTNCQTSANKYEKAQDKVQDAKNELIEAKSDLKKAQQDSYNEYLMFKKESDEKISAHDKNIAEFRARIAKEKMEVQGKYEMQLALLEKKNSDMKKKLVDYKEEGKDQWEMFKTEFNRDMDELGNAFKDLVVKNTK